jgi:hypothetical protein
MRALEPFMTRVEFVGGRFFYAMRVNETARYLGRLLTQASQASTEALVR